MYLGLRSFIVALLVVGGSSLAVIYAESDSAEGQSPETEQPVLISEARGEDGADGTSGGLVLVVPAASVPETEGVQPPVEQQEPPVEPKDLGTEDDEDPPTFFGEPVAKKTVFVLDVSDSMHKGGVQAAEDYDGNVVAKPTRLELLKFETVKMVQTLEEEVAIDFVLLAGGLAGMPLTDVWKGEFVPMDDTHKDSAITFVKALHTWWGTPTHRALDRATHEYEGVEHIIFLSDGQPYPTDWKGEPHKEKILQDFPGWFGPLKNNGCKFTVMQIGNHPLAQGFLEQLASQNDAKFVHVQ